MARVGLLLLDLVTIIQGIERNETLQRPKVRKARGYAFASLGFNTVAP